MLRRAAGFPLVALTLLAASCAPPPPSAVPCNDDSDCAATEACVEGRCSAAAPDDELDAGARVDASTPGSDAGRDSGPPPVDAGAPSDAGPDDGGSDAGVDAGPPCEGPDEDGDFFPDACDNCPSVANVSQLDLQELLAGNVPDGVGDACDPRPTEGGDSILLFEGFHEDVAPSSWQALSCTWTVTGGEATQHDGAGAKNCRLTFPAVMARDVVVETSVRVLTFENESTANVGALVSAAGGDAWLCSQHAQGSLMMFRAFDGTVTSRARTPLPVTLGAPLRLSAGGGAAQVLCRANDDTLVYHHIRGGRPEGAVALRTNDATASYAYVTVYQLGGDVVAEPPDPPRHRYSFNDDSDDLTARDSEGDQHGVVMGDATRAAGALVIDGASTGYLDLPNGVVSALPALTVEGWVTWNGNGVGTWQHLFDFGTTSVGELTDVEPPDAGLAYHGEGVSALIFTPSTNADASYVRLRAPDGSDVIELSADPLPAGRPVHVAITYDPEAGYAALYIDGGERDRDYGSMPLSALEDVNNWIGRSGWSNDSRYDGSIDEVRLYDRALSPREVLGSFQAGPDASF